jgi:nucleoside-diphosphate kinase
VSDKSERTLVLIKPDAIQRGLVGAIISRLEAKGLKLVAMKMLHMDEGMAKRHYEAHIGKTFFPDLVRFITSSPLIAMVWQGREAVEVVRKAMGATDPVKAEPGTIRGDFGLDIGRNLVHGSDSLEAAEKEIALFFDQGEILDYPRDVEGWITES